MEQNKNQQENHTRVWITRNEKKLLEKNQNEAIQLRQTKQLRAH
jgi:hypothetical protein